MFCGASFVQSFMEQTGSRRATMPAQCLHQSSWNIRRLIYEIYEDRMCKPFSAELHIQFLSSRRAWRRLRRLARSRPIRRPTPRSRSSRRQRYTPTRRRWTRMTYGGWTPRSSSAGAASPTSTCVRLPTNFATAAAAPSAAPGTEGAKITLTPAGGRCREAAGAPRAPPERCMCSWDSRQGFAIVFPQCSKVLKSTRS